MGRAIPAALGGFFPASVSRWADVVPSSPGAGGVEVVSHDYVDDIAGTAAGRAVAALLAAAMEFAF